MISFFGSCIYQVINFTVRDYVVPAGGGLINAIRRRVFPKLSLFSSVYLNFCLWFVICLLASANVFKSLWNPILLSILFSLWSWWRLSFRIKKCGLNSSQNWRHAFKVQIDFGRLLFLSFINLLILLWFLAGSQLWFFLNFGGFFIGLVIFFVFLPLCVTNLDQRPCSLKQI